VVFSFSLLAKHKVAGSTPVTRFISNLPNHTIYLKLKVDGVVSRPLSAETLSPAYLSAS
jgi:hypothetical protein